MKLTFFGAARTTTGSKYLLEVNHQRILIECGMFQGHRNKTIAYNSTLPFDAADIDLLLLSHAHIDHSGIIPVLCREGFRGKIVCTDATADLCRIMLLDSAHIQEQDAAFLSKKRLKKGEPPVQPLYTQADATESLSHLAPVRYNEPVSLAEGVTATWQDAGHILGSASIVLDLQEGDRTVRFAFSGDIGRGGDDILRNPDPPRDVDYLMLESTYGNRVHESQADLNDRVCALINQAVEQQGKIIIPAFSVGRTQRLLYTLYHLTQTECLPVLPIFVDSPLSLQATEVFRRHPECYNRAFYDVMLNRANPFSMDHLTYIQSVEESIALNERPGPAIILSASGMAEAGRIRHHLKNNIGDPRNLILIVGWCAPHTLGARLAAGDRQVSIFGEPYRVRARVETLNAFSGHADQNELRAWAERVTGNVRGVFVVHGEEAPAQALAGALRELRPEAEVTVPQFGDVVEW